MSSYQLIMLLIITVFYLTYVIKQLLLKRRGIDGTRLAKGSKPKRTMGIERALLAVTYSMVAIQYAGILLTGKENLIIRSEWARIAGTGAAFLGMCFFISAVVTMKDSWRAGVEEGQKTKIITKGVYSISRNPAFVGFDLLYLGVALTFSNIVGLLSAAVAVVLLHFQILEEEKMLPGIFGPEYLEYKKRTRRYL